MLEFLLAVAGDCVLDEKYTPSGAHLLIDNAIIKCDINDLIDYLQDLTTNPTKVTVIEMRNVTINANWAITDNVKLFRTMQAVYCVNVFFNVTITGSKEAGVKLRAEAFRPVAVLFPAVSLHVCNSTFNFWDAQEEMAVDLMLDSGVSGYTTRLEGIVITVEKLENNTGGSDPDTADTADATGVFFVMHEGAEVTDVYVDLVESNFACPSSVQEITRTEIINSNSGCGRRDDIICGMFCALLRTGHELPDVVESEVITTYHYRLRDENCLFLPGSEEITIAGAGFGDAAEADDAADRELRAYVYDSLDQKFKLTKIVYIPVGNESDLFDNFNAICRKIELESNGPLECTCYWNLSADGSTCECFELFFDNKCLCKRNNTTPPHKCIENCEELGLCSEGCKGNEESSEFINCDCTPPFSRDNIANCVLLSTSKMYIGFGVAIVVILVSTALIVWGIMARGKQARHAVYLAQ